MFCIGSAYVQVNNPPTPFLGSANLPGQQLAPGFGQNNGNLPGQTLAPPFCQNNGNLPGQTLAPAFGQNNGNLPGQTLDNRYNTGICLT